MAERLLDHGDAIFELPEALDAAQCEAIIAAFEAEPGVRPGIVERGRVGAVVDPAIKRSVDFSIADDSGPRWRAVDELLRAATRRGIDAYAARYPWLWRLPTCLSAFQIQRSRPGDGFDWHVDEDSERRLALIVYLNEGFDGGATQFELQGFSYAPRRGSLLMFPPFWTHPHRGQPVAEGVKYIATAFLLHYRG